MRRAAKVDAGSQAIRAALRQAGADVAVIGQPLDWLVGYKGVNYLLEVKAPGARRRTDQPTQDAFLRTWREQAATVRCLADALRVIGAIR